MSRTRATLTGRDLASRGVLARGFIWNLIGMAVPLAVAVVAYPLLLQRLGPERFGVLIVIWTLVGYSSVFDLGLERALTKLIADRLGKADIDSIPRVAATGLLMLCLSSGAVAALVYALAPWLGGSVLNVPAALAVETGDAFRAMSWSIPLVVIASGLRGVLAAFQEFIPINVVRVAVASLILLSPVAISFWTTDLGVIAWAVTITRLVALGALAGYTHRLAIDIRRLRPSRVFAPELLSFGGWMMVTNIVGPVMTYLDRLFLMVWGTAAAVAYYAAPADVVTKITVLPVALTATLFPAFAYTRHGDQARWLRLYQRATGAALVASLPPVALCLLMGPELLTVWLGDEVARHGALAMQILALGVLINCVAQIPYNVIQGAGRADWTAKLHLAELPFYLVALYLVIPRWGIPGVAVVWTVRVVVDTIALIALTALLEPRLLISSGSTLVALTVSVTLLGTSLTGPSSALTTGASLGLVGCWLVALAVSGIPNLARGRIMSLCRTGT